MLRSHYRVAGTGGYACVPLDWPGLLRSTGNKG